MSTDDIITEDRPRHKIHLPQHRQRNWALLGHTTKNDTLPQNIKQPHPIWLGSSSWRFATTPMIVGLPHTGRFPIYWLRTRVWFPEVAHVRLPGFNVFLGETMLCSARSRKLTIASTPCTAAYDHRQVSPIQVSCHVIDHYCREYEKHRRSTRSCKQVEGTQCVLQAEQQSLSNLQ